MACAPCGRRFANLLPMCPLCGALLAEHWSDADGAGARRGRVFRTRVGRRAPARVRRRLSGQGRRGGAGCGVTVSGGWGTAYGLPEGMGRAEVVHDRTTLWSDAERLAG